MEETKQKRKRRVLTPEQILVHKRYDKIKLISFCIISLIFIISLVSTITSMVIPPKIIKVEVIKEVKVEVIKEVIKEVPIKIIKEVPLFTKKEVVSKKPSGDTLLLAQLLYGECRGESDAGILAAGTVVLNRIGQSGYPNTLKGVIYQGNGTQFNCIKQKNWGQTDSRCIKLATKLLNGHRTFGKDVVFFYNPITSTDTQFIKSVSVVQKIGNHVFAKES